MGCVSSSDAMMSTVPPAPPSRSANPWLPMGVIMAATIMVALDTTIVNVALHEIGTSLDAGAGIEWVVTAYLLGVCAGQPVTGWLTDRFGRRRVFLVSLLGFTVASALCALSPTLPALIGARALQGLGGGSVMPVGMAIALDLFPPARRGRRWAPRGVRFNCSRCDSSAEIAGTGSGSLSG